MQFDNVVCEMPAILFRPQCVKTPRYVYLNGDVSARTTHEGFIHQVEEGVGRLADVDTVGCTGGNGTETRYIVLENIYVME